jgi:hypothetical protein
MRWGIWLSREDMSVHRLGRAGDGLPHFLFFGAQSATAGHGSAFG